MSRNGFRIAVLAVAAVAVILTFVLLGSGSNQDGDNSNTPVATITPESPLGDEESPSDAAIEREADLARRYIRCAKDAGFDPEFAQAIADTEGTPRAMMTGVEVPASVHRPCFVEIGGVDPHRSSYGTFDN